MEMYMLVPVFCGATDLVLEKLQTMYQQTELEVFASWNLLIEVRMFYYRCLDKEYWARDQHSNKDDGESSMSVKKDEF